MTKHTGTPPAISAPCPRPVSMEITPIEYERYMQEAQRMRAEAMAGMIERWFSGFARLFVRAKTDAPDRARDGFGSRPA